VCLDLGMALYGLVHPGGDAGAKVSRDGNQNMGRDIGGGRSSSTRLDRGSRIVHGYELDAIQKRPCSVQGRCYCKGQELYKTSVTRTIESTSPCHETALGAGTKKGASAPADCSGRDRTKQWLHRPRCSSAVCTSRWSHVSKGQWAWQYWRGMSVYARSGRCARRWRVRASSRLLFLE
jgi:hypothetical protein